jgi:hypothetical protein
MELDFRYFQFDMAWRNNIFKNISNNLEKGGVQRAFHVSFAR